MKRSSRSALPVGSWLNVAVVSSIHWPFGRANPLVAVEGFAQQVAVGAAEVFAEAVQRRRIAALFRGLPTGDQDPLLFVRVEVVTGVDRVCGVGRLGGDKEALLLAGLPGVDQVAVATGALVAEVAGGQHLHPWRRA